MNWPNDRIVICGWTSSLIKNVLNPEKNYCRTFDIFQSATHFLSVVTLKLWFKYQPCGHFMRNEAADIQMDGVICFNSCRFLLLYYSFSALRPNAWLIMVSISVLPERFSLFNCAVSPSCWLISAVITHPESGYSLACPESINAIHGLIWRYGLDA